MRRQAHNVRLLDGAHHTSLLVHDLRRPPPATAHRERTSPHGEGEPAARDPGKQRPRRDPPLCDQGERGVRDDGTCERDFPSEWVLHVASVTSPASGYSTIGLARLPQRVRNVWVLRGRPSTRARQGLGARLPSGYLEFPRRTPGEQAALLSGRPRRPPFI